MDPSQVISELLKAAGVNTAQLPANVDLSPMAILRAIVILVVIYFVARIARGLLARISAHWNLDPRVKLLLLQLTFYGIIALGIIWVLGGFGLSVILLSVVVGFALKDLIENFAAGVLIMATRPFQPGDWISVAGSEGQVSEVGWRGTFVEAFDGRRFIIPNSDIITNVVTNNSIGGRLRTTLNFSVGLRDDLTRVEELVHGVLKDTAGVANEPPPRVLIDSLTGNSVNLSVLYWVNEPARYQRDVQSRAWRGIKDALLGNGIELNPAPPLPLARAPLEPSEQEAA